MMYMFNWMRSLIVLNMVVLIHPTILRLPCTKYAAFEMVYMNKSLKGHLIQRDCNVTDVECMKKCIEHVKCQSYNTNRSSRVCELSSKAIASDAGTQLSDDPGWVYKSTDYKNKLVGPVCNNLKPCLPNYLCKDTCTAPFYECLHCHEGLHCDKPIDGDMCSKNPCRNGKCIGKGSNYECTCTPGYSGKSCNIDINECDSLPCFNGGNCTDNVNSFQCSCSPGYSGVHCEKDINECDSLPCFNGGNCTDNVNSFQCSCSPGYSGVHCEKDIDECASSPCHNLGTCINLVGQYKCNCTTEYAGTRCELESYVGCYKDGSDRALPNWTPTAGVPLIWKCIALCRADNYPYAGLQYFDQCWCGHSYDKYKVLPESSCNTICKDSSGKMCGGSWANSVYRT